jgi:hypothetical protein
MSPKSPRPVLPGNSTRSTGVFRSPHFCSNIASGILFPLLILLHSSINGDKSLSSSGVHTDRPKKCTETVILVLYRLYILDAPVYLSLGSNYPA